MSSLQDRIVKRSLPSALNAYQEFVESLLKDLEALGWQQCDLFGVHMALEESISNAIRHGNKQDLAKRVEVECRYSDERFWLRVCDEGVGFVPEAVPDCCAPERLEVPGGRGLTLIRAFMSWVEYNEQGNCVTMEKRLGDDIRDDGPDA